MAQFDVHTNLGRNRQQIPYVVVVQSRRFDATSTRLVAPLMRPTGLSDAESWLTPRFQIETNAVLLNPLLLFAAPLSALGPVVASLTADADASQIIAAIDAVITQAVG